MALVCPHCETPQTDAAARFCNKCGKFLPVEVAPEEADGMVGQILLDRYRILSVLGEGGMGKVYLAEQRMGHSTRKVAIKTLHADLSQDPQLVARFHRETETVIGLEHPNTIKFFEFGEFKGQLFIVMEYIQGESLAHVLQRGPLDAARCEKILIQICGSLHEAHQLGVVHRDLKPENIILTNRAGQTDFVKVLDFGIAKRSDAEDPQSQKLTKQGMVLGTPPYMSPEQFTGQALDGRSDIYSLGVMAYEMLAGALPFDAKTPWEWASKHMTQPPRPLDTHPPCVRLPPRYVNAVMRALAKQREQRHQNVMEFLREFTGIDDPAASWTMATSGAGAVPASSGGMPVARTPVGTPAPMPQTAASPMTPPAFQQMSPVPGMTGPFMGGTPPPVGYGPTPGPSPAYPPGSGYVSTSMPTRSGGGAGKVIAIVFVALIVGAGGVGGIAWLVLHDSGSDPPTTLASTTQVPTVGPTTTLYPTSPTYPTYPTSAYPTSPTSVVNPTIPFVPTQPTGVAFQPIDAGSATGLTPVSPTGVTPLVQDAGPAAPPTVAPPTVAPPTVAPPTVAPPTVAPPTVVPDHGSHDTGPSPADEARARAYVSQGLALANGGNLEGAIGALRSAQRLVGRSGAAVRPLRSAIASRGGNKVGILIQQGRCPQAQALYSQLRSVGAEGNARSQFGDWCSAR